MMLYEQRYTSKSIANSLQTQTMFPETAKAKLDTTVH